MSWRSCIVAACLTVPSVAGAQAAREVQVHGAGVFASQDFIGGGLGAALRSRGRARADLAVSVGAVDGAVAGRGELVLSYHLSPYRRRGLAPYAGGGIAVQVHDGDTAEYIVLLLGVESAPMRRTGWFAEVGFAGGVRVVGGFRVRWRSPTP